MKKISGKSPEEVRAYHRVGFYSVIEGELRSIAQRSDTGKRSSSYRE
jgi:hypothetical protein